LCLVFLMPGSSLAQAPPAAPTDKLIDIGAGDAPLSQPLRDRLATAIAAHDYAAETAVLKAAIAGDPKSPKLPALFGRIAFLEGHPSDAADLLAQSDRLTPLTEADRLTLALGYGFSHRGEQGQRELAKLIKIAPQNAEYPYWAGRLHAMDRNYQAAAGEFRMALGLNPNLLEAYEHLGVALEAVGNLPEAQKVYEEAARRNRGSATPSGAPPLILGAFLEKIGRIDDSEACVREAIGYQPRLFQAHYRLGTILEKRQKDAEAVAEFRQATALMPSYAEAYLALSSVYAHMQKPAEAADAMATFRKLKEKEGRGGSGR
jgi:tetratricopeptide (TPR) repeat protein